MRIRFLAKCQIESQLTSICAAMKIYIILTVLLLAKAKADDYYREEDCGFVDNPCLIGPPKLNGIWIHVEPAGKLTHIL